MCAALSDQQVASMTGLDDQLSAPDGKVFDACEEAVIAKGRKFQAQVLGEAVGRRIDAAEKKGRRSASVPVGEKKKIADPKSGT